MAGALHERINSGFQGAIAIKLVVDTDTVIREFFSVNYL
jgi:hypothetical protein